MSETQPEVGEVWTNQGASADWAYEGDRKWRLLRSQLYPENVGITKQHGTAPFGFRRLSPAPSAGAVVRDDVGPDGKPWHANSYHSDAMCATCNDRWGMHTLNLCLRGGGKFKPIDAPKTVEPRPFEHMDAPQPPKPERYVDFESTPVAARKVDEVMRARNDQWNDRHKDRIKAALASLSTDNLLTSRVPSRSWDR